MIGQISLNALNKRVHQPCQGFRVCVLGQAVILKQSADVVAGTSSLLTWWHSAGVRGCDVGHGNSQVKGP